MDNDIPVEVLYENGIARGPIPNTAERDDAYDIGYELAQLRD